jgi:hypothetical protein
VVLVFAFVVFVGYARGRVHHRGPQQVGAPSVVVVPR